VVECGFSFQNLKTSHPIEGLQIVGPVIERSKDQWRSPLQLEHDKKLGPRTLQLRSSTLDFIAALKGSAWRMDWPHITPALETLHRPFRRGSDCISVLMSCLLAFGHPKFQNVYSCLFAISKQNGIFLHSGQALPKRVPLSICRKTRALLPFPAVLIVADAIVACKFHYLANHIGVPPACVGMSCAMRGTQGLGGAHAVQLHLQKGCYIFWEAGLAQLDTHYYYSVN
jgi:hypothetical protein